MDLDSLLPKLHQCPMQSIDSEDDEFLPLITSMSFPPPDLAPMAQQSEKRIAHNKCDGIVLDDSEDDEGPPILECAISKHQLPLPTEEPKTVLEALQRFNQSRKSASTSFNLQSSQNNLFNGLSASPSPSLSSMSNSASSAAADLTRLIPSLLKKPITPLAAPKKKLLSSSNSSTTSNYSVISFRKSTTPNTTSFLTTSSSSIHLPESSPVSPLSPPPSSSRPSVSISIKETSNNPLLELIIAESKKQEEAFIENEQPPTLTNCFESLNGDDKKLKNTLEELKKPLITPEFLPPILEKFCEKSDLKESDINDLPPKLVPQTEEKMASSKLNLRSVHRQQQQEKMNQDANTKRGRASQKQEQRKNITKDENDRDVPPTPELYSNEKKLQTSCGRGSSTSSGVSSSADCHSPPSCSPLAPINGEQNRRSGRLFKEPQSTTTLKFSKKRKLNSSTSGHPPAKRRRPCKTRKSSESQKISNEFMDQQSWIPMGQPWAEMISTGGANSKTKKTAVCCFPAVKHKTEAITFNILDCISVAAGGEDGDNIGKIDRIFLDKKLGMCVNVLWYYKIGDCILKDENRDSILKKYVFDERELIASKHIDTIPCDSIQSHAFVLTFSEYCRYVAENKFDSLSPKLQSRSKEMWSRGDENYRRRRFLPHEDSPSDLVFFCRKYYSIERKAIYSSAPTPTAAHKRRRQRKRRPVTRLLPVQYDDSDDTENRNKTP